LIYSTFLGGSFGDSSHPNGDFPRSFAVDSAGNAYVGGITTSSEFPLGTPRFFTGKFAAYVAKLNPTGTGLVYLDYLDGNFVEEVDAIAIDSAGNAVVTGQTNSFNFPTTGGAYQTSSNNDRGLNYNDVFVTKLNSTGGLIFSTFVSGNFDDVAYGIAL